MMFEPGGWLGFGYDNRVSLFGFGIDPVSEENSWVLKGLCQVISEASSTIFLMTTFGFSTTTT